MLKIIKVDENNIPIKNVVFDILDENHSVVDTIITNKEGVAISNDLLIGKYYYKELKAPKEYVIDSNEYPFEISFENTLIEKNIVNKRVTVSLRILKLDKDNKEPIEGVSFEILDKDKNQIAIIVTGKDGIAEIDNLHYGKYYFREISAPERYLVDNRLRSFKLDKNNEIFEITVYNSLVNMPVTGGMFSLDMLIVVICTVISLVGFFTIKMFMKKNA